MNISIIGKNSNLYKSLKFDLHKTFKNIESISHKELDSVESFQNSILFSYSNKDFKTNKDLIDKTIDKTKGFVIYVSTTAIFSNHFCSGYKYPQIKKRIENYLFQFDNVKILRVGLVEGFFDPSKFIGPIKYSSLKNISKVVNETLKENIQTKIVEAWEPQELKNSNFSRRALHKFLGILINLLRSKFHFTRPLDLIMKLLGEQNYGYTYLSNQFELHSKYTIVGTGMSALGVQEALEEKDELHNVRIIHARSSLLNYYESTSSGKSIESVGNGGNSNLWHSVISNFSEKKDMPARFETFFSKAYPKSIRKFKQSLYSFIPLFPIRPLKKIVGKKRKFNSLIDDKIFYIEEGEDGKSILHGTRATYTTEILFLCTGAISSIKLLTDSELIKTYKSNLSEHLVGYFGQFSGKLKTPQVIRTCEGHLKKFHEIKLDNRSLYVTFRPANFNFKNLIKANNYRNFFGKSSKSIYLSLLTKANLGLIVEALYNKFGLEFKLNSYYNIAGHIESKGSVHIRCCPFENPYIHYNEKEIVFSESEINSIKDYLRALGIKSDIRINKTTSVSPGLHFLNSNLKTEILKLPNKIKLLSTILFEDESPKHPTFDLYINSYTETRNLLETSRND